jgi:hypothetical protein
LDRREAKESLSDDAGKLICASNNHIGGDQSTHDRIRGHIDRLLNPDRTLSTIEAQEHVRQRKNYQSDGGPVASDRRRSLPAGRIEETGRGGFVSRSFVRPLRGE